MTTGTDNQPVGVGLSLAPAAEQAGLDGLHVCWVGTARYTRPLDPTAAAKWSALAALGVRMSVIAFSADMLPRRFDEHAQFILMPRPPLAPLRYLVIFTFAPLLAFGRVLRGANVLVAQSPYDGAIAGLVKQAARLLRRRVVLIVENHGDFEEAVFMQRRVALAGLYRALMRALARYAFRRADLLRSISSVTHEQLERWADGQPIERFMTWTDAGAFRETARGVPLRETQDIVCAGVLIPLKGVHILLDAFARLAPLHPGSRLWVVGRPENRDYAAQLEQQARDLGIAARVTFVGGVPQAELARTMARARVLAIPSLSEGLGRVVVEAMMVGTPVVGSRVGGIPDLIEHGVNGLLVPPGDARALAGALRRVLEDPDIEAMGHAAKAFADGFFSPEMYVAGYRRLFERAARILAGG